MQSFIFSLDCIIGIFGKCAHLYWGEKNKGREPWEMPANKK